MVLQVKEITVLVSGFWDASGVFVFKNAIGHKWSHRCAEGTARDVGDHLFKFHY